MNKNLFRKSSIDRVNSPEQLNEYIRVANPGVWIVLAAVVALLIGVVVWSIFGTIETTVETCASVNGDTVVCYVSADDISKLKEETPVTVEGCEGSVKSIPETPMQIGDSFGDYALYLTGFAKGDFCYAVELELTGVKDGVYPAVITTDSVNPIYFIIH